MILTEKELGILEGWEETIVRMIDDPEQLHRLGGMIQQHHYDYFGNKRSAEALEAEAGQVDKNGTYVLSGPDRHKKLRRASIHRKTAEMARERRDILFKFFDQLSEACDEYTHYVEE